MKNFKTLLMLFLAVSVFMISCDDDDDSIQQIEIEGQDDPNDDPAAFVGAVYAMTNGNGQVPGTNVQGDNTIIAYGRDAQGGLTPIGPFATNGFGGDFDGGEGLDPLISAYALTKTPDNSTLLAVNAGSNTITSFNINDDFSLAQAGEPQPTGAVGPNSIAFVERDIAVSYTHLTLPTKA